MLWLRHLWIRLLVRCCVHCGNWKEWMRFYRLGSLEVCLAATTQQLWQLGTGELFMLVDVGASCLSQVKPTWVLGWKLTVQHWMESESCCQGCSAFWSNMDGTVQKLAQMKDLSLVDCSDSPPQWFLDLQEHTECLVNYANSSKPLRVSHRGFQIFQSCDRNMPWQRIFQLPRILDRKNQGLSRGNYECLSFYTLYYILHLFPVICSDIQWYIIWHLYNI